MVKESCEPVSAASPPTATPFSNTPSSLLSPAAAATAAVASAMPLPHWLQRPRNSRAVFLRMLSTAAGVILGFMAYTSAPTAATCGAAIEVP